MYFISSISFQSSPLILKNMTEVLENKFSSTYSLREFQMLLFILHLGQFSWVGHWTFGARGSYSNIIKWKVNLRLNSEVMSPPWGLQPVWSSPRCGWTRARAGCCQGCWACRQPCWRVPECVIWSSWSWWGLVVTWKCRAQSLQLNRSVM